MSTDHRESLGIDHKVPMDTRHEEPMAIGHGNHIETSDAVLGPSPGKGGIVCGSREAHRSPT